MTVAEAIRLANSGDGLEAILIEGMHAVVSRKDAEKADARGVEFSYLCLHDGKSTAIPNRTAGG